MAITSYYILRSRLIPALYKVGITKDIDRRFEQHGGAEKFELVDACTIGKRDNAERFEKRILKRFKAERYRKGAEDLALSDEQVAWLRAEMQREHEKTTEPNESKSQAHFVGSACAAPRNLERPKSEPVQQRPPKVEKAYSTTARAVRASGHSVAGNGERCAGTLQACGSFTYELPMGKSLAELGEPMAAEPRPQTPQTQPARVLQFEHKPKKPDPVSVGDSFYRAVLVGFGLTLALVGLSAIDPPEIRPQPSAGASIDRR